MAGVFFRLCPVACVSALYCPFQHQLHIVGVAFSQAAVACAAFLHLALCQHEAIGEQVAVGVSFGECLQLFQQRRQLFVGGLVCLIVNTAIFIAGGGILTGDEQLIGERIGIADAVDDGVVHEILGEVLVQLAAALHPRKGGIQHLPYLLGQVEILGQKLQQRFLSRCAAVQSHAYILTQQRAPIFGVDAGGEIAIQPTDTLHPQPHGALVASRCGFFPISEAQCLFIGGTEGLKFLGLVLGIYLCQLRAIGSSDTGFILRFLNAQYIPVHPFGLLAGFIDNKQE